MWCIVGLEKNWLGFKWYIGMWSDIKPKQQYFSILFLPFCMKFLHFVITSLVIQAFLLETHPVGNSMPTLETARILNFSMIRGSSSNLFKVIVLTVGLYIFYQLTYHLLEQRLLLESHGNTGLFRLHYRHLPIAF